MVKWTPVGSGCDKKGTGIDNGDKKRFHLECRGVGRFVGVQRVRYRS